MKLKCGDVFISKDRKRIMVAYKRLGPNNEFLDAVQIDSFPASPMKAHYSICGTCMGSSQSLDVGEILLSINEEVPAYHWGDADKVALRAARACLAHARRSSRSETW